MNHPFLALLLIAGLLACPMRCVSCEADVAVVDETISAGCACCSHAADATDSSSPQPREGDECRCQNCLCEGAVFEADVVLPDAGDLILAWQQPFGLCESWVTPPAILVQPQPAPDRCLYLCGRDARIAHQSWLI